MFGNPRDPPHNNHRPRRGQGVPVSVFQFDEALRRELRQDLFERTERLLLSWAHDEKRVLIPMNSMAGGSIEGTTELAKEAIELIVEDPLVERFYVGRSIDPQKRKTQHKNKGCVELSLIRVSSETEGSMRNADWIQRFEDALNKSFADEGHPKRCKQAPDGRGGKKEAPDHFVYLLLYTHDPEKSALLPKGLFLREFDPR